MLGVFFVFFFCKFDSTRQHLTSIFRSIKEDKCHEAYVYFIRLDSSIYLDHLLPHKRLSPWSRTQRFVCDSVLNVVYVVILCGKSQGDLHRNIKTRHGRTGHISTSRSKVITAGKVWPSALHIESSVLKKPQALKIGLERSLATCIFFFIFTSGSRRVCVCVCVCHQHKGQRSHPFWLKIKNVSR